MKERVRGLQEELDEITYSCEVARRSHCVPLNKGGLASASGSLFVHLPHPVFLHFLSFCDPSSTMDLFDAYGEPLFRRSRLQVLASVHDLLSRLVSFHGRSLVTEDVPSGPFEDIYDQRYYFHCQPFAGPAPAPDRVTTSNRILRQVVARIDSELVELVQLLLLGGFPCHVYSGLVGNKALMEQCESGYNMGREPSIQAVTLICPDFVIIHAVDSGGMVEYRGLY